MAPHPLPATGGDALRASIVLALFVPGALGAEVSDLSSGQMVGIIVGSVCGAVLVILCVCVVWCWCFRRKRRDDEVNWNKYVDMESATAPGPHAANGTGAAPHGPGAASGRRGGGTAAANPLHVALTADAVAEDLQDSQHAQHDPRSALAPYVPGGGEAAAGGAEAVGSGGLPLSRSAFAMAPEGVAIAEMDRARSSGRVKAKGGGLLPKAFSTPWSKKGKEKASGLQVSRSARVEPSAEVELPAFEGGGNSSAAASGPPLSKSSMLMRWLHGFDEPHELQAKLVAAASGGKRSSGGPSPFADNLPLLSLAAQSGIVFNKMPPSVASSPAVSVTEGSLTRHMLKGTSRRGIPADDPANMPSTAPGDPSSLYPASLARASVESLQRQDRGAQQRPGIVFDSMSATPLQSRLSTQGGAAGAAGGGAAATAALGSVQHTRVAFGASGSAASAAASAASPAVPAVDLMDAPLVAAPAVPGAAAGAGPGAASAPADGSASPADAAWTVFPGAGAAAAEAPPAPARAPMLYETAPQQLTPLMEDERESTAGSDVEVPAGAGPARVPGQGEQLDAPAASPGSYPHPHQAPAPPGAVSPQVELRTGVAPASPAVLHAAPGALRGLDPLPSEPSPAWPSGSQLGPASGLHRKPHSFTPVTSSEPSPFLPAPPGVGGVGATFPVAYGGAHLGVGVGGSVGATPVGQLPQQRAAAPPVPRQASADRAVQQQHHQQLLTMLEEVSAEESSTRSGPLNFSSPQPL